jgi:hypothetical protein
MMEETKTFKLPITGKTVTVKGYMTGFIDQEIQRILLSANKSHFEKEVDPNAPDGEKSAMSGSMKIVMDTDPTVQLDADKKMIELMVLSVDGVAGDIVNQVLNLPKQDVDFIKTQLKGVEDASKVQGSDPKAPNS